jgi:hypothetical protein
MMRNQPVKNGATRETVNEPRMEPLPRPGKVWRHIACADGLPRRRSQA